MLKPNLEHSGKVLLYLLYVIQEHVYHTITSSVNIKAIRLNSQMKRHYYSKTAFRALSSLYVYHSTMYHIQIIYNSKLSKVS